MARKERENYRISSVCKALNLLEEINCAGRELQVTELVRRLGTSHSLVLRLLLTLESRDLVEKDDRTGCYRLGLAAFTLGRMCINKKRLIDEGRPALEKLAALSGESAFLSVTREDAVVHVDAVESTLPVRAVAAPGFRMPMRCTAAGKMLLAHGGDALSSLAAESLRQERSATTGLSASWQRQLEDIRKRGYALDLGEYEPGLYAVAAPVRDAASRVIAAVSVVGPSFRLEPGRLAGELSGMVVQAGRLISLRMGYKEDAGREELSAGRLTSCRNPTAARLEVWEEVPADERAGRLPDLPHHLTIPACGK